MLRDLAITDTSNALVMSNPLTFFLLGSLLSMYFFSWGFMYAHLPLLLLLRLVMVRTGRIYTRADDRLFGLMAAGTALLTVPLHWSIVNYVDIQMSAYECEAHAVGCGYDHSLMWEFAFASPIAAYVAARILASDIGSSSTVTPNQ
jgi:hypothetical protein